MTPSIIRSLIPRACDRCKERKSRCVPVASASKYGNGGDSHFPRCQRCEYHDMDCTFQKLQRRRGPKRRITGHSNGATASSRSSLENIASVYSPTHRAARSNSSTSRQISSPDVTLTFHSATVEAEGSNRDDGASILVNDHHIWTDTGATPHQPVTISDHMADQQSRVESYSTDSICSRQLVNLVVSDYLRWIYPLLPVVHRPSFLADFNAVKDSHDATFCSLLIALLSVTAAVLPRHFQRHHNTCGNGQFATRKNFVNKCVSSIMRSREADYFDTLNHTKWAIAYVLRITFYHMGENNRSRMMDAEEMQLARILQFHVISEYRGLNCISQQLRKKAFWLTFYSYV